MTSPTRRLELSLLPERFAISRLAADAAIPNWATEGSFFSVTRTGDELSVVCELARVPVGVPSQPGWRVFKVHGPFVLTEIGVLSALAGPLAESKLSLFAISTFETDYLLVASETLSAAIAALERAGHKIYRSKTE
ncbi:MAG TPA: ACT domain-containing protein [Candidatus Angelobacter sp.]|nr:ACT domain-containing protein [Candidatus Angelobacter sp.]